MTRLDALAVQEQDARGSVYRRLDDLERAIGSMRITVAKHALPSTVWLKAKAQAVAEAVQLWEATAHALSLAEEQQPDTPMNNVFINDRADGLTSDYVAIQRTVNSPSTAQPGPVHVPIHNDPGHCRPLGVEQR